MTTEKSDLKISPENMDRRNLLAVGAGAVLTAATLAGGARSAVAQTA